MVKLFSRNPDRVTELMNWDMRKLIELGVREEFFLMNELTSQQLEDMVKGLLYLREKYPDFWEQKREELVTAYKKARQESSARIQNTQDRG